MHRYGAGIETMLFQLTLCLSRTVSLSSPTLVRLRGSLITLGVISMTRATSRSIASIPFPLSTITRRGRWKPSVFKHSNRQFGSFNFLAIIFPLSTMSVFFRTLSRPTTSSGPSFQSPLFRPLREMIVRPLYPSYQCVRGTP